MIKCLTLLPFVLIPALSPAVVQEKPVFNDFMGLCVHTINFKPELYAPAIRQVRDYHNIHWDLGGDTSSPTQFPKSANNVHWENLYGDWVRDGYEIDASLTFNHLPPEKWADIEKDVERYGEEFARYFGPSGHKLVTAAEIGNEPGVFSDEDYTKVFKAFATGLRRGDPKLTILTGNLNPGESDKYSKSVTTIKDLAPLYDVLKIHTYAQVEGWPTWKRTYPEDPDNEFLSKVQQLIDWRDANVPGKEVWVTEFGWDSTTKPNHTEGNFKDWEGVTDTQQAQYLVRAFLCFSNMAIDRAYIYFFNDKDEPSVHAAAGLTRNFVPKPSLYAVSHLRATLGDYRFKRVIKEDVGELYVYEYQSASDPKKFVWAAWSPTGNGRTAEVTLNTGSGKVTKAERMPLAKDDDTKIKFTQPTPTTTTLTVTESPAYLFIEAP